MTETIDSTSPLTKGYLAFESRGQRTCRELVELLTIGRDPMSQVVLLDPYASARHARIERRGTKFILRDLQSRNGVFVNGTRVTEKVLEEGDQLLIGETKLEVVVSPEEFKSDQPLHSKNPIWQEDLNRLPSIAASEAPVLLSGPSGAGKDVIANAIHQQSRRRQRPFVAINCSALSESLIESELFGHVRGSFTGALNDRPGAFQSASGGTLFLDEIGDLPLGLQPKLLRALENEEIRPVGGDSVVKTNVRIVAATHQDLRNKVSRGEFRQDLYFRLHVVKLTVPALISRMEDFDDLFYHFARHHRVRFSHDAIAKLKEHRWPGNIRELKNTVARAKAYYGQNQVHAENIAKLIDIAPPDSARTNRNLSGQELLKSLEVDMIQSRLVANLGNQRRTAEELGMPKSTLHDRIRTYQIDVHALLKDNGINLPEKLKVSAHKS